MESCAPAFLDEAGTGGQGICSKRRVHRRDSPEATEQDSSSCHWAHKTSCHTPRVHRRKAEVPPGTLLLAPLLLELVRLVLSWTRRVIIVLRPGSCTGSPVPGCSVPAAAPQLCRGGRQVRARRSCHLHAACQGGRGNGCTARTVIYSNHSPDSGSQNHRLHVNGNNLASKRYQGDRVQPHCNSPTADQLLALAPGFAET